MRGSNATANSAVVCSSDFLVAIGFPVLVLAYCLHTFEYDCASQLLAAEFFSPWSFANAARAQANPEQTAKVFKSIEGLRFQSVGVCIARIGNNLALLVSLRRLLKLLRGHVFSKSTGDTLKSSIYPRKHPLALLLVAIALATVVFVSTSVHRSQQACRRYPTCTIHAYRWRLSSAGTGNNCPCRVIIDADPAPTSYSAWSDPPDATADVSSLAASGDLEILQIINRRLPELPETLRRCSQLKHMYVHAGSERPFQIDQLLMVLYSAPRVELWSSRTRPRFRPGLPTSWSWSSYTLRGNRARGVWPRYHQTCSAR